MTVQVYIPTSFRRATENQTRVELDVPDVKALLEALEERYAGLRGLVRDAAGEVHHHVNVYVNGEEIGSLRGQATVLRPGDEVSIIPALAGGTTAPAGLPVFLAEAEVAAVRKQAEAEYPAECCGVVLVGEKRSPDRRLYPCRNIQNELHAKDSARFPRDARTAYYVAHEDLLEIGRQEAQGYGVGVIYHSHVDTGAYFSETDRRNALVDGEPAYPHAAYVVVAVHRGEAREARAFRWDPGAGDFTEVPLTVG